jgi:prepilin-type N-terminal cleavage/methylation domain-containing protein
MFRTASGNRPAGFSLIEVIIAMSLLCIVMIMLATMAIAIGRRGRVNDFTAKRNLALAQQAGRIEALPFPDVVTLASGTTQMLVGDFTFNRRLTVTPTGTTRYTIKVVVAPLASEFKPDSVTIVRTRPAAGMPLCTIC